MASNLLLLNEFLPPSALGLGWLADSLKTPTMDAYENKAPLSADAIMRLSGQNFEALANASSSNSFRLSLTRLLSTSNEWKHAQDEKMSSLQVSRYQLRQPKALFRDLVRDEAARRWLNDSIESGRKSYLVVELQTAMDPAMERGKSKGVSTDVDLTVPVSTIATGGVDILGLGEQLDSSVGGGYARSEDQKKKFSMEGEQIFAIGFKRIVWKSFGFRKNIDQAKLDDRITWSVFGEKRGNNDEEVIGADLADELDGKYEDGEDDEDDEDEDEDDEVADLLKSGVSVGDQVYMVNEDDDE